MKVSTQILVLAASRTQEQGNASFLETPPYLVEFKKKLILEHLKKNTSKLKNTTYTYVFSESDTQKFHVDKIAGELTTNCKIILLSSATQGSGCTALFAACQLEHNAELLILSANELIKKSLNEDVTLFRKKKWDAATWAFRSLHPRYSYIKQNKNGLVIQASQREPISRLATTGAFWFAKTHDFIDAAENMIINDSSVDNMYFLAPVFNEMILRNKKIGIKKIHENLYLPLKTQKQLELCSKS